MTQILYEGNIVTETVGVISTGIVALTDAIVTKEGKIFRFINGNCMGIAVGIAIIAGGAYYIYKYIFPSSIPESIPAQLADIPNFAPLTQDDLRSISSIGTQTFKKQHEHFSCPITKQLMREPYTLKCGHDFEKQMIRLTLNKDRRCPLCRQITNFEDGVQSRSLKQAIKEFRIKGCKKGREWLQKTIQQDFINFQ